MFQAAPKTMTLEEFLDWYPDGYGRFELHDGVVVEMQPTGPHEQVGGFLALKSGVQIERLELPYLIPRQCIIKPIDSDKSGFIPDIAVLDKNALESEPMWQKRSTIIKGETVRLAIEVVSTNWQDDYLIKLAEYEKLGILEYWIVDYLGLGGRRYIGNPKQPTISVYQLIDGEYIFSQFRDNDRIESVTFPEWNLTAEQIFQVGK
ncbi:MAG: Uma2 family endonuclease [Coleofasciculaceae cyanobacterium]